MLGVQGVRNLMGERSAAVRHRSLHPAELHDDDLDALRGDLPTERVAGGLERRLPSLMMRPRPS